MIEVAPLDVAAITAALGVLVQNWRTNRRTRAAVETVEAEVSPNHGSSMRDSVARTETTTLDTLDTLRSVRATLDGHGKLISSLGHQLGELRDDARQIHEDHAARLRALERPRP